MTTFITKLLVVGLTVEWGMTCQEADDSDRALSDCSMNTWMVRDVPSRIYRLDGAEAAPSIDVRLYLAVIMCLIDLGMGLVQDVPDLRRS